LLLPDRYTDKRCLQLVLRVEVPRTISDDARQREGPRHRQSVAAQRQHRARPRDSSASEALRFRRLPTCAGIVCLASGNRLHARTDDAHLRGDNDARPTAVSRRPGRCQGFQPMLRTLLLLFQHTPSFAAPLRLQDFIFVGMAKLQLRRACLAWSGIFGCGKSFDHPRCETAPRLVEIGSEPA